MRLVQDAAVDQVMFRLSGPVRIERGSEVADVGSSALRTLMAALLLERGAIVHRDLLVDYMWDNPPKSAGANLRGYVCELRRQLNLVDNGLADVVTTLRGRRGGYALAIPGECVDVLMIERFARVGNEHLRAGDFDTAAAELQRALDLWDGPVGQGCSGSVLLTAKFDSLGDLRTLVRERLAAAQLLQGRAADLLPDLHELVSFAPHREAAWELLMRASYLGGDIGRAVDTWKRATSTLAEDFGLEPSSRMIELHLAILRRDDDAVRYPRAMMPCCRFAEDALHGLIHVAMGCH